RLEHQQQAIEGIRQVVPSSEPPNTAARRIHPSMYTASLGIALLYSKLSFLPLSSPPSPSSSSSASPPTTSSSSSADAAPTAPCSASKAAMMSARGLSAAHQGPQQQQQQYLQQARQYLEFARTLSALRKPSAAFLLGHSGLYALSEALYHRQA